MKFIIDANLPTKLNTWIKNKGYSVEHVFGLNLLTASDQDLWNICRANGIVFMTKDWDFYDKVLLLGAPPQIIHFQLGNCSNNELFNSLEKVWDAIISALENNSPMIAIAKDRIKIY